MSRPKEARDRLFKYGRPNIRPLDILEEGGIGKDMAVLWGAYRKGGFEQLGEVSQEDFTQDILKILSPYEWVWIIEDKNYNYPKGYGPVGLMVARFNGWEMEPHFQPFPWATPKNKVKSVVSFMQMARYEKGVGVLNVFTGCEDKSFFDYLSKKYKVMYYVGKIHKGGYGDDKYLFYGRGGSFYKGAHS